MLKAKYSAGCLIIASMFFSCAKDETYDVVGDSEVKFFTNATGAGNAPQNSINYNVVNIPDGASSSLLNLSSTFSGAVKFPVFATKPVSDDVTIGAELDTSLVAAYNAAHGTSYNAFPLGIFSTNGLVAHIPKGANMSTDSISVAADVTGLNKLTQKAYMAPIKLTSVSNKAVGSITSNTGTQIIYVVANVERRRVKYLATTADVIGSLLTPRTAWTASFNQTPTTTGSIFDGSTTTYNKWSASPVQVDVNMQDTKNVTGIRLYTATSATYVPTQVDVYLSNDGINYDLVGSPLKANLTYASGYNYILFYQAIPAKYIRLNLYYSTSTNTQNVRLAEFDVYAN
jgi:hypothetical protein